MCVEVKERVKQIVKEMASNPIEIECEQRIRDLGIDSLATVELVLTLEDCFNIQFDDSDLELEKLQTVEDLINLVELVLDKKR